jgi:Ran GTPase-activating protein (RanGAP) involved in mRNA processing and transport
MSDYKASLEHMRNVLGSCQFDRTGAKTSKIVDSNEDDEKHKSFNLLENKDLLNIVTKYTPSQNALLSMTSKTVKDNLEKGTPVTFRPTRSYMKVHNSPDGRENMLKSLQSMSTSYNLISIDMPGLALVGDECDSVSVKLADVLSNSQNLEYLNLSGIGIRTWSEIGAALLSCPKLKRVDFSLNRLSPTLFRALSKCLALEDLDFHDSIHFHHCIHGLGVVMFERRNTLTKLNCSGCSLNHSSLDNGFEYIAGVLPVCSNLNHLDLSQANLDTNAMTFFETAMKDGLHGESLNLESLNLSNNTFGDNIAIRLAPLLAKCHTLKYLHLKGTSINKAVFDRFITCGSFRVLKCIDLSNCHINCIRMEIHFGEELSNCTDLTQVILSNNSLGDNFAEDLVTALPNCTSLTCLHLNGTCMSDVGVRGLVDVIPQCPWLTRLNICDNMLSMETREEIRSSWRSIHSNDNGLWMDMN